MIDSPFQNHVEGRVSSSKEERVGREKQQLSTYFTVHPPGSLGHRDTSVIPTPRRGRVGANGGYAEHLSKPSVSQCGLPAPALEHLVTEGESASSPKQ